MSVHPPATQEPIELTEEQKRDAEMFKKEMNRLEDEAPRYDVEYHTEVEDDGVAVMRAASKLEEDLDGMYNILNTVVNEKSSKATTSVTLVIATEVRNPNFDNAFWHILADPRSKHYLWCKTDYEIDVDMDWWIEASSGLDYPVAEWETEFLRE